MTFSRFKSKLYENKHHAISEVQTFSELMGHIILFDMIFNNPKQILNIWSNFLFLFFSFEILKYHTRTAQTRLINHISIFALYKRLKL